MPPENEKKLEKSRFEGIIEKITNETDRKYFQDCYEEREESGHIYYERKNNLKEKQRKRLWRILVIADKWYLFDKASNHLVAYYIHRYRTNEDSNQSKRIADDGDDYFKAQYLNHLVEYFEQKGTRQITIGEGNKTMEEIIDMVYNIYDRAYFHKEHHSGCSNLECFVEAERYYCEEKALDYLAFLEYLNRVRQGLPGDEKTDYENAEKNYKGWGQNIGSVDMHVAAPAERGDVMKKMKGEI